MRDIFVTLVVLGSVSTRRIKLSYKNNMCQSDGRDYIP